MSDAATLQVWYINRGMTPVLVHGQHIAKGAVLAVAGVGRAGFGGDGGPALEAELRAPAGLATDGKGNLYIADRGENTVRVVDRQGTMATVAGTGQQGFNGDGLKARLTALNLPSDVELDACGNLLIADTGNGRIRRLRLVESCATEPAAAKSAPRWGPVALVGAVAALAMMVAWRTVARRRNFS